MAICASDDKVDDNAYAFEIKRTFQLTSTAGVAGRNDAGVNLINENTGFH